MSLIAAKADYIYKANEVYNRLNNFESLYEVEANVLTYAKCAIVQENELVDFVIDGIYVSVYNNSKGYDLYFLNYLMKIEVYDKQIIYFSVRQNWFFENSNLFIIQ